MTDSNLLRFFFDWNLHDEKVRGVQSYIFGTGKNNCVINPPPPQKKKKFDFIPLINSSVTTG